MKMKCGPTPYIYPVPIVLAGSLVEGKPTFTTIGDVGLMGIKPPLVYISSHANHYLNLGIQENSAFSINFPTTEMLALVDYCGQVSGRKVDKAALFEVFYGDLEAAPLIENCPVNLECEVEKEFSIEHRQIFVGRVVQTHIDQELAVEKEGQLRIADLGKLDPVLYALDNRYYRVGEAIGLGYQEAGDLLNR